MRIATVSRKAMDVMVDLAIRERAGPVKVTHLSTHHAVSVSYLEHLFIRLRECGLVEGVRGPGGGYVLARAPESISALDVVLAVDDQALLDAKRVVSSQGGDGSEPDLWDGLSAQTLQFLRGVSIKHLTDLGLARAAIGAQAAAWPLTSAPVPLFQPSASAAPST